MHSKIVSELEAAQEELTKEAVDAIKVNQVTLGNLSASYSGIVAPLLDAKTRKFMITPEGSEQHELVTMGVALDDFQKLVNTAETTLQNLWADWKEAKAEIEAVGREIDAPKEEVIDADSILIAQEHDAALAELNEDIDALTEKHIAEYKTYEKVNR